MPATKQHSLLPFQKRGSSLTIQCRSCAARAACQAVEHLLRRRSQAAAGVRGALHESVRPVGLSESLRSRLATRRTTTAAAVWSVCGADPEATWTWPLTDRRMFYTGSRSRSPNSRCSITAAACPAWVRITRPWRRRRPFSTLLLLLRDKFTIMKMLAIFHTCSSRPQSVRRPAEDSARIGARQVRNWSAVEKVLNSTTEPKLVDLVTSQLTFDPFFFIAYYIIKTWIWTFLNFHFSTNCNFNRWTWLTFLDLA